MTATNKSSPNVYAAVLDWRRVALHVQALTLYRYSESASVAMTFGALTFHSIPNRA